MKLCTWTVIFRKWPKMAQAFCHQSIFLKIIKLSLSLLLSIKNDTPVISHKISQGKQQAGSNSATVWT